jgi:hypothetical protein
LLQDRLISSHWREMLKDFDGTPETLRGAGETSPRSRNLLHRLFQKRWLELGTKYEHFPMFLEAGRHVARIQGRAFDLNMLRQAITLAYCMDRGMIHPRGRPPLIVIGDGYAALGTIYSAATGGHVTFMNIAPVLRIDEIYFRRVYPFRREVQFLDAERVNEMPEAGISIDVHCLQEVNPDVRDRYLELLSKRVRYYSYSANRESKTLPDGTVTKFSAYGWPPNGNIMVDEPCPWGQDFYNFRPPFFRKFDGPVRHRIVRWRL